MGDKTLTCKDCGADFIFTEGEQAFYKERVLRTNHRDVLIAEGQKTTTKQQRS